MAEGQTKPFNKILLLILIGLMILTGSINTIFNKILQKLYGKGVIFEQHHWIITFGMFLGELVSIFLYAYIVYKRKKQALQKQDDNLLKESEERLENQGEGEGQENAPTDDKKDPTEAEKKLKPIPTNFFFIITA